MYRTLFIQLSLYTLENNIKNSMDDINVFMGIIIIYYLMGKSTITFINNLIVLWNVEI